MQVFTIRVPDDMYEWLRNTAFEQRTSMTALIVAALAEARKKAEKAKRAV